jgi:transposase
MTRPYLIPEGSKEKLKAALKRARSADALRRVQCIWMRVELGLSNTQIAAALGWSAYTVRDLQQRYRHKGEALFEGPGKGGRRRELMSTRQEFALLRRIREEAFPSGVVDYQDVHQAVEKAVGRRVDFSTVHRMLKRHGWYRKALVSMPSLPDPSGQKWGSGGRTGIWYMPIEDEPQTGAVESV